MIRGAIFDVDGTILDSMPAWFDIGKRYIISLGIEPDPDLSDRLFHMALNDGADFINEHYHLNKTRKEIIHGITDLVMDFYENEAPFKEGVKELLDALKAHNIPMSIATAGDMSYLGAALKRLGIDDYFEHIYTCTDLNTNKSSPYIFQRAAEDMGLSPQDVYVFEDALKAVRTAKAAGFKVVGIYDFWSAEAQYDIKSLCDIYIKSFCNISLDMLI